MFLAVVSSGVILSLSTAIGRFSSGLEKVGIIQILPGGSVDAALKIVADNKAHIASAKTVDKAESAKLLKNYLKGGDAIMGYIPTVIRIQAKSKTALDAIAKQSYEVPKLRFAHGQSAAPDRSVGIKIMGIAIFLLIVTLGALVMCITYSVKNIVIIHKREIEILHQVGSTNAYIANQIQIAMISIGARAGVFGMFAGWVVLFAANGISRQANVGLLANMGMVGADWAITFALAASLVVLSVLVTRRTAVQVLDRSKEF